MPGIAGGRAGVVEVEHHVTGSGLIRPNQRR